MTHEELNAEIAKTIFGATWWHNIKGNCTHLMENNSENENWIKGKEISLDTKQGCYVLEFIPNYTDPYDIAHFFKLLNHLQKNDFIISFKNQDKDHWICEIDSGSGIAHCQAETLPLALCNAALHAWKMKHG